jgi:hypothetical protein
MINYLGVLFSHSMDPPIVTSEMRPVLQVVMPSIKVSANLFVAALFLTEAHEAECVLWSLFIFGVGVQKLVNEN